MLNRFPWRLFLVILFLFNILPSARASNSDMVILIDNSGSMKQGDPQFLLRQVILSFASKINHSSRLSLISFDQETNVILPFTTTRISNRALFKDAMRHINYRGMFTDIASAVEKAIYVLRNDARPRASKAILLVTDGIMDTGNLIRNQTQTRWLLNELAEACQRNGIRLFGVAFSDRADFKLLQSLGTLTHGDYFRVFDTDGILGAFRQINTLLAPSRFQNDTIPVAAPQPPVRGVWPTKPAISAPQFTAPWQTMRATQTRPIVSVQKPTAPQLTARAESTAPILSAPKPVAPQLTVRTELTEPVVSAPKPMAPQLAMKAESTKPAISVPQSTAPQLTTRVSSTSDPVSVSKAVKKRDETSPASYDPVASETIAMRQNADKAPNLDSANPPKKVESEKPTQDAMPIQEENKMLWPRLFLISLVALILAMVWRKSAPIAILLRLINMLGASLRDRLLSTLAATGVWFRTKNRQPVDNQHERDNDMDRTIISGLSLVHANTPSAEASPVAPPAAPPVAPPAAPPVAPPAVPPTAPPPIASYTAPPVAPPMAPTIALTSPLATLPTTAPSTSNIVPFSSASFAKLVDRRGANGLVEFPLTHAVTIVSRNEQWGLSNVAHLCINDPSISRRHAAIEFRDSGFWLRDLGSTNGTYVNNVRVKDEVRLQHGDFIRFDAYGFDFMGPAKNK